MNTILSFFASIVALFSGLLGNTPIVSNTPPAPTSTAIVATTTGQNTEVTNTAGQFTAEDKARGWYYGDKDQKKQGTPVGWVLKDAGTKSARWVATVMPDQNTGSNTAMNQFTAEDQAKGWYYGDKDQKKQGTPANWILKDAGTRSARWVSTK